jgi:pimeloyl-ACP methyl ester carboxylesterase
VGHGACRPSDRSPLRDAGVDVEVEAASGDDRRVPPTLVLLHGLSANGGVWASWEYGSREGPAGVWRLVRPVLSA